MPHKYEWSVQMLMGPTHTAQFRMARGVGGALCIYLFKDAVSVVEY